MKCQEKYDFFNHITSCTICTEDQTKREKSFQKLSKVVKEVVKKFSKVAKKLPKSCQKVIKKLSKKLSKNGIIEKCKKCKNTKILKRVGGGGGGRGRGGGGGEGDL
jgi:hypothetical protein